MSSFFEKTLAVLGLSVLLAFAAFAQFSHLGSGTPSWDKTLSIFSTKENLQRWVPAMAESRKKYWTNYAAMLSSDKTEEESRAIFKETFTSQEQVPLFSPIPPNLIPDIMRGYVLGVFLSDDQYPMVAISNLNPLKGDFNPNIYAASGGLFYYTAGVFLAGARAIGKLSLTPGIEYYFTHPEESRALYATVRAIGGCAVLATILLIYFLSVAELGAFGALLAAAFFAVFPACVFLSHAVKAHLYGMFWVTLGVFFCSRIFRQNTLKNWLLAGLFLGCAAGSIITNLVVGIVLFWTLGIALEWQPRRMVSEKKFYLAALLFFAVYAVTNFYVLIDWGGFQKTMWSLQEYTRGYDEYGTIGLSKWVAFFKDTFTVQVNMLLLPLLGVGLGSFLLNRSVRQNRFFQLCFWVLVSLTLFNLLTMRHLGVNARVFALIAIFSAQGAVFIHRYSGRWGRALLGLYVAGALSFSALQTTFYVSLWKEPSHFELAARWVHKHIPAGSSLGVVGSIAQSNFPPIRFMDYRLIKFPLVKTQATAGQLPAFVVTVEKDNPNLKREYVLAAAWRRPTHFAGVPFWSENVVTGNNDVFVYRKK